MFEEESSAVDLATLIGELERMRDDALSAIPAVDEVAALEELELEYLGRKGRLTTILRGIGALAADDRPRVGASANVVREALEAAFALGDTAEVEGVRRLPYRRPVPYERCAHPSRTGRSVQRCRRDVVAACTATAVHLDRRLGRARSGNASGQKGQSMALWHEGAHRC